MAPQLIGVCGSGGEGEGGLYESGQFENANAWVCRRAHTPRSHSVAVRPSLLAVRLCQPNLLPVSHPAHQEPERPALR